MIDRSIATSVNLNRRQSAVGRWLSDRSLVDVIRVSFLLVAHVLLGLFMSNAAPLTNVHVGGVLIIGCWYALSQPRLERAAYLGAYITGAETLWRMTHAAVFWEIGKYAIAGVFVLALLRTGRLRGPVMPFLFLLLMLPSLVMPMASVDETELRQQISFNLSGPMALAASAWFFSHVKLSGAQLQRMFLALICPVVSIATIAVYKIMTAEKLVFIDDSNPLTSGGFGPNQVSAILGLGSLVAFLLVLDRSMSRGLRIIFFLVSLGLIAQSALTFSRSGLYMACGGAILAVIFLIQDRRARLRLFAVIVTLFLAINFILLPQLDEFTGGALSKRFSDTQLTGRGDLALADLQVFSDHPVFGVGPGQTRHYRNREIGYSSAAAHTEFSRLLSEHGLFGLIAIVVLLLMALQHFRRCPTARGRAVAGSMTAWSLLFMIGAAMRLVAPSFVFGLTAATILPEGISPDSQPEPANAPPRF
ncbi:MAG: O-antigen ligase family protein [Blastocatellales bacterium]